MPVLILEKVYPGIFNALALTIAAYGLAKAIERLSKLSFKEIITPVIALSTLIVLLASFVGTLTESGSTFSESHKSFKALALLFTSLLAVSGAIVMLSKLEPKQIWSALGVLSGLIVLVSFVFAALSKISDGLNDSWRSILALSAFNLSLIGFAISLRMLSNTINQNGDAFVKAIGYIITLLATYALFSVVVGIASRSNDALSKSMSSISKLTLALIAFAVTLAALSKIKVGWDVLPSILAMIALLAAFTVMIKMLSNIDTKSVTAVKNALNSLKGIILSLALLTGVMYLLKGVDQSTINTILAGYIGIILSLSILVVLLKNLYSDSKLNAKKVKNKLVLIGALLSVLAGTVTSIKVLSGIPWPNLLASALTITSVMIVIGGLLIVLSKIKTTIKRSI